MDDEEIKSTLSKPFEDAGIHFLVDAYHEVDQKTKCKVCGKESNFKITNIGKDETFYFCDLHIFKFCSEFIKSYRKNGILIKDIDDQLEGL